MHRWLGNTYSLLYVVIGKAMIIDNIDIDHFDKWYNNIIPSYDTKLFTNIRHVVCTSCG